MNLKLSPLYLLSFLILVFLVHELHDWAHTLVARAMCPCWGMRVFDGWDFCPDCFASAGARALATVAGPVITFIFLWIGWSLLNEDNQLDEQSLGCTIVLACLPLNILLAATAGGGDLTNAIRWLEPHDAQNNPHFVSLLGLLIVVVLTVPPLVRTFLRLPGYRGKFILFPIFLLVPRWLDHWVVSIGLNRWLIKPDTDQAQAYTWVIAWLILLLTGWFFTRRQPSKLMQEMTI
jgi:hypothetical protein